MTKVSIFAPALSELEAAALSKLVVGTGSCEGAPELILAVESSDALCDDGVVLFLGTTTLAASAELEQQLASVVGSSQRAIWVWPEKSSEFEIPIAARKFCYSIVPWDQEKLADVIADDDVTCFETANGISLPKVETERNICVDEDEEVKPR